MAKASIQFKSINRMIAILRPKQAFLDWINSMPDDPNTMTMELVAHENLCFLIPEYESNEQGREFILKNAEAILEVQLEGWDQSGETWPEKLERRLLQNFFDIEIHSEVFDMMKGPIEREDFF